MEISLPLISVIVPSFNQGQFLSQALDSIFNQNYPRVEVLIMDGGSTDDSVNIIQRYEERLTYWQSQPDQGQAAAINEGVSRATGDLVVWLNSDDFYYGDCFWKVADAYHCLPDRGAYIGNGFRYEQASGQYKPFSERHLAFNREALTFGLDYILQPAVFFSRQVWNQVNGLDPSLYFCMDWDILIRIGDSHSVALINDFLAVSREYQYTKTSRGKLKRAYEIAAMIARHTGQEVTPGSAHYFLETLLDITASNHLEILTDSLYSGMQEIHHYFDDKYGNKDGFPEAIDSQDKVYMPFAQTYLFSAIQPRVKSQNFPQISIVVPSYNQANFLKQTLESIFNQGYENLEVIVIDGGSSDDSIEIIKAYQSKLAYWHSEPDTGPADAINQGFSMAQGEIIAWLSSDDMLAQGALWAVAEAFILDEGLDLVFGNALYIDEQNGLYLADHGTYRTGLYYGRFQPYEVIPQYWTYVHEVPQPTVFFRNSLLDKVGKLDEKYSFIFDFELFYRFSKVAKIRKLERIQAFYRIHSDSKTSVWSAFLVELYSFSRPKWPSLVTPKFWPTFKSFLKYYMKSYYPNRRRRDSRFLITAVIVSFSVFFKIGNPEYLKSWIFRKKCSSKEQFLASQTQSNDIKVAVENISLPQVEYPISQQNCRYRAFFCSFFLPLHPGYSGGEIRDFHILRHLLSLCRVDFFALRENPYQDRDDILAPYLNTCLSAEAFQQVKDSYQHFEYDSRDEGSVQTLSPVTLGDIRYHHDVEHLLPASQSQLRPIVQHALDEAKPDFLFVSPQVNPIMLGLQTTGLDVRCILASYDVEIVRVKRVNQHQKLLLHPKKILQAYLEPRRAARFERDNLVCFDGLIAVSELDKSIFISEYGFEPERVLVINNSVDTQYFSFIQRQPIENPNVTFVGSLTYPPNQQAAYRLIKTIMPLVRQQCPTARLWIVGQSPSEDLLSYSDDDRVIVTGKVEDVRPYLAQSAVMCAPLSSGSGTKYKILEALSAGVPVVCSGLALEGLNLQPDIHLLQADTDKDITTSILRLILDSDLATRLAHQGRALIEQEYAWDRSLQSIDKWLDLLTHLPKRTVF